MEQEALKLVEAMHGARVHEPEEGEPV